VDPFPGDAYHGAMQEIVDARDVLDTNARIKHELEAQVLGYFERTGPNRWDDYRFVAQAQGTLAVLPGIPIHLEARGTDFRLRKDGQVLRVRWAPGPRDPADLPTRDAGAQREYFLRSYLEKFDEAAGVGTAAWIANKLGD
jgi:hypothetical protein